MQFIESEYTTTLEIKKSKFITHITSYDKFHDMMTRLRDEHPKARHFVVAYRYLNEFNQIVEHSSDDGEPKGTSGKPSLFVLQGSDIINSAVIIVRYFGGTKLGTGGLVRAYSDAVNLVLNEAELMPYKQEIVKKIQFDYSNLRMIEYECLSHEILIINKFFDTDIIIEIKASKNNIDEFLNKVDRLVSVIY